MGKLSAAKLRDARRRYLQLVEERAGIVLAQEERDSIQIVVFRDFSELVIKPVGRSS